MTYVFATDQLIMRIAVQNNRVSTLSNMAIADSATVAATVITQPMYSSMSSRLGRLSRISAKAAARARAKAKEKSARVARMLTEPLSPRTDQLSTTVIVATASTWVSWGITACSRHAGSASLNNLRTPVIICENASTNLSIGNSVPKFRQL